MSRSKSLSVLLVIALLGLTVLLAASLNTLKLSPGQPFQIAEAGMPASGPQFNLEFMLWILRCAIWGILIAMPFGIFFLVRTKEGRRRLANLTILLIVVIILGEAANRNRPPAPTQEAGEAPVIVMTPMGGMESSPFQGIPPLVAPTPPPGWLPPVVTLILAAILGGAAVLLYWLIVRPPQSVSSVKELADEMQEAIDDLESGADLRQTIIRCYREMNRVVQRSRGLHRDDAATPREFERLLVKQGLPSQEVIELTRMFEAARYGEQSNRPAEKAQAIACLKQIVNACRKTEAA